MTDNANSPFPESFEGEVRDCLSHLYDFSAMQNDSLAERLVPELIGLQRVQKVRHLLVEAIENLNLNPEADLQSRQGRVYNVLFLRYVEEQPTQEILHQLSLSERQFYREHRRAIQALCHILWQQIHVSDPANLSSKLISVETEVQRAHSQLDYVSMNPKDLFRGVIEATQMLADQQQVSVEYQPSESNFDLKAHRMLLRQTLIWLTSQLIKHTAARGHLSLTCDFLEGQCVIYIEVKPLVIDQMALQDILRQQVSLKHLIQTQHLELIYSYDPSADKFRASLKLPWYRKTILVIDDNPDVISLITRFTAHLPISIVAALEGDQAIQFARELKPSTIILDVMLPGKDGWEILQTLKNHPDTHHLPVFICSVLETPELALSLGADGFLKKPPEQIELLRVLGQSWE